MAMLDILTTLKSGLDPNSEFGSALKAFADKDTAYRNDLHMQKVYAANPEYAKAIYGQRGADDDRELKRQMAIVELQKLTSGANSPAALQMANEYRRRLNAGDVDGANDLVQFAKTMDKGVVINPQGEASAITNYANTVGGIASTKKGMERQAEKNVDVVMNPQIAAGEAGARNASDLQYAEPISTAKKTGEGIAEIDITQKKKGVQADDTITTLDIIETKDKTGKDLLDKATGSGMGAIVAAGKGFAGKSDESTQANADLALLGSRLVNNVPRMEGPQSDADRQFYIAQAGKIADPTVPGPDKRSAIKTIRKLQEKYAKAAPVSLSSDRPRISREDAIAEARRRGLIK